MCFVVFSLYQHPRYKLVFAANRDEFYERPTEDAHFWPDDPGILGGLDLKCGGTWLGITQQGRFGAITNYRDPAAERPDAPTRGALVANYLRGDVEPSDYAQRIEKIGDRYNGFNLLVGDSEDLFYVSNYAAVTHQLEPGLYGLSNHILNTDWPKVRRGKALFSDILEADVIDPEQLLTLLRDGELARDQELPNTGIDPEWERMLSPIFIQTPMYGTRSSSVLLIDRDNKVTFVERTYNCSADPVGTQQYTFHITEPNTSEQEA